MRYAGVKNNRICLISDEPWVSNEVPVIPVPEELSHIPSKDLILNSQVRNGRIICKLLKRRAGQLKVALVGNWKVRCGIATYSENLWGEVVKHVGDYKLFIENNSSVTGSLTEIGGRRIAPDKVSVCWKRGESLKELADQIKIYDPDIVWIQHEFGLWPNASHWLSLMNQLSRYRVIVTMHSVFHHKDKTIVEAAMPEIVVHLQGGYNVLKNEKHVPGKVYVIPHGCFPCTNKERLWNFYKSEHTFMQAGFGFRYKNFESPIIATSLLKEKYPDVFLTILFSESPHNIGAHQMYYNDLMDLIEKLNIQENVAIIRGFQSDETLDSYFRTNKAAVFSYVSQPNHEVFGASGAARLAMATNIPVITSYAPHFSDLPTIKTNTPEDIAHELDILFSDKKTVQEQLLKQETYLAENSWANIAERYIKLFEDVS